MLYTNTKSLFRMFFNYPALWFAYSDVHCKCKLCVDFKSSSCLFLFLANLTGHAERVGIENFELLKVLGTGGEYQQTWFSFWVSCCSLHSNSDLVLCEQPTEKCFWCAKWADTTRASCMQWRYWKKPPSYRRRRQPSTHVQRDRCWSISDSLRSSSLCTMPSRQTPSFTSF